LAVGQVVLLIRAHKLSLVGFNDPVDFHFFGSGYTTTPMLGGDGYEPATLEEAATVLGIN